LQIEGLRGGELPSTSFWITTGTWKSFTNRSPVQAFAERVLALPANLDDDGTVPVIFSSGREPFLEEIRLDGVVMLLGV
jgi:hypothetical protein